MNATLADALRASARDAPDRILVRDDDSVVTAAQLLDRATVLAHALTRRMPVGSIVSFTLPNWHEAAIIYLGTTLAGMIANPILPSLRDHELSFILADANSRAVFIPQVFGGHDYVAMLNRVVAGLPDPPDVVVVRGDAGSHTAFADLLGEPTTGTLPVLDPSHIQLILYTSGTTGRPKGVLHSHDSLHALITQLGRYWRIEPGDTFLVPSPVAHIGGSIYAFECPLLLGTQAVLMQRWDPDRAVALMLEHVCTHMAGATPFLDGLLAAAQRADTRLPDLKVFICGGASVPPSLIRRATQDLDKAAVSRVYGSTEVPVTTVGSLDDAERAADTDGRPGVAEVVIVDGEIRSRGPQMFRGYLHPEDSAGAFDESGYFRTGDLGRFTDDGHLVVTGRAKDIIIRNGENISPKEVEDILVTHPQIAEIAIVGVPDSRTGERACATIVAAGGGGPEVADLHEFLVAHGVAKFKVPEQVRFVDALPKNDAGKVLKHVLRAELIKES